MRGNGNNFLDNYYMNKIPGIKHIFFDLDHTLWDFDKNSAIAFFRMFKENDIAVSVEDFLNVYIPINFEYWKYYREARITKEKLRFGRLYKTFSGLGYAIDERMINKLSDDYIRYLPENNHLFEGAHELLKNLNQRYTLHIITNGFEEVQSKKLCNSGIDVFFSTVTTSEAAGVKKPHPKIFNHALGLAGSTILNSVMVGDTYEADIVGAQQVGMQTICFNYHKAELTANERAVSHLLDILDYL